jgi:hypothetical protein
MTAIRSAADDQLLADSVRSGSRSANCRSRVTNKPRRMAIDGRSQLGRRVRDLAETFAVQLGGWPVLSDLMAANVRRQAS